MIFSELNSHFNKTQQTCRTIKENKHEEDSFILTWLHMLHQPRWGNWDNPIKNSYLLAAALSFVLGIISKVNYQIYAIWVSILK